MKELLKAIDDLTGEHDEDHSDFVAVVLSLITQDNKYLKSVIAKAKTQMTEGANMTPNLLSTINEQVSELDRIVAYWVEQGNITNEALQHGIGTDLEMLEYSPEEVEKELPKLVDRVKASRKRR